MDKTVALDNINFIKQTLDESRITYKGLYKLCIINGLCNSAYLLSNFLLMLFSTNHLPGSNMLFYVCVVVRTLYLLVPVIAFVIIYKSERNYNNRYYLSIIDTWAVISIILPIFKFILSLIQTYLINQQIIPSVTTRSDIIRQSGDMSYLVLFLVAIIIYSNISGKRSSKIIGLVIVFIHMLLLMIEYSYLSAGIQLPYGIPLLKSETTMAFSGLSSFFILGIGYIIIGVLIKRRIEEIKI